MSRRPSWLTSNFVTKFTTTHINSSNFEWFGGFVTINEMLVLSKCYRWFWNTRGPSSSDWVSYYRGERRGQVWTKRPETSFLTLRCFQACLSSFPVLNPTKRLISAPLHSVSRHRRSDIVKFGLSYFYLVPSYFHCSFWPRTAWRCQWTPWSTTACPTPSWAWQTWRTLITAQSRFFGKYHWIFHEMTIFQTACTNITQKHSGNEESSRDSQWQRQHCGRHAGVTHTAINIHQSE